MASFFDARTVKSQTGLQAPAILSVQGRNHDVQVRHVLACAGLLTGIGDQCGCLGP